MKKISLILLTVLTAWSQSFPQMSLQDCLVYARDHAHANRINRIATEKAATDKKIALSSVMPYVGFDMNGNLSFGRNIDPETNTYDNKQTLSSSFSIGMSLPVFDGLVKINNIKASEMAHLQQKHASQTKEDEISLAVIRAFFNVSFCKAMVAQVEENLLRDNKNLSATILGLETGTKSEADVADIKALVASDEYELTNQKNLLSKAYLQLRAEMGMEPDPSPLEIIDDYEDSPVVTSESMSGFQHPEIAEAIMAEKESRYLLRAAKGAFSPAISFHAGISTSYYKMINSGANAPGFSRQWHDNMGQYLGVTFSIPLFTGFSAVNKLKRARLDLMQKREILEQTRFRIERETSEAALDYSAATEEWHSAKRRLDAEQLAFNATNRKYELGSASAIDLYTASAKLSVAKANFEGKRIQMIISSITLSYYNGIPLIKVDKDPAL